MGRHVERAQAALLAAGARRHLRPGAAGLDRRTDRGRPHARRRRRVRCARRASTASTLAPDQLRVTADEIAAAPSSTTTSTPRSTTPSPTCGRSTSSCWRAPATGRSRPSRVCTVGEKVTPIASAGLFVPSGKASYPSVAYQLGVPAVVAGVPHDRRSSCRRSRAATARSTRRCSSCAASSASPTCSASTGRPASPRSGSARESIPQVRKIVGPGFAGGHAAPRSRCSATASPR